VAGDGDVAGGAEESLLEGVGSGGGVAAQALTEGVAEAFEEVGAKGLVATLVGVEGPGEEVSAGAIFEWDSLFVGSNHRSSWAWFGKCHYRWLAIIRQELGASTISWSGRGRSGPRPWWRGQVRIELSEYSHNKQPYRGGRIGERPRPHGRTKFTLAAPSRPSAACQGFGFAARKSKLGEGCARVARPGSGRLTR
jgi:hypothetical protein